MKEAGKLIVKSIFTLFVTGVFTMPFWMGGMKKDPGNPLSHRQVSQLETVLTETYTSEPITPDPGEFLKLIPQYVQTPEGGTEWKIFGETKMNEYSYKDKDDFEWTGVHPEFTEDLKKLDGKEIMIQGYMFPLDQEEKQTNFLFGPFPVSCPYHYHSPPNLIIEAHAKTPVPFSYDPINIKGKLELVPKDDEYNVFYRLQNTEVVPK